MTTALALALALLAQPAHAQMLDTSDEADAHSLSQPPRDLAPLELSWVVADGVPRRYREVEGWLLLDAGSRRFALRADRYRWAGATLTSFGGAVLAIGAGIGVRNATEDDESGFAETWTPVLVGAALVSAGIPLLFVGDAKRKKAIRAYGSAGPGGGALRVQLAF